MLATASGGLWPSGVPCHADFGQLTPGPKSSFMREWVGECRALRGLLRAAGTLLAPRRAHLSRGWPGPDCNSRSSANPSTLEAQSKGAGGGFVRKPGSPSSSPCARSCFGERHLGRLARPMQCSQAASTERRGSPFTLTLICGQSVPCSTLLEPNFACS